MRPGLFSTRKTWITPLPKALGEYTEGERQGQPCVCKWFKSGAVFERDFFELDIKAVDKALEIIAKWNAAGVINKPVRLNRPEVWTFVNNGSSWAGQKVLQEPFVENWEKFNSNSGWVNDETPWPRVMQALSHFSYHSTAGAFVLCDLQGGVYSDGVVLSDPVILSRTRQYGVTDLGADGISTFFSQHVCNEFCRSQWSLPRVRVCRIAVQKSTSMVGCHVPTRTSRPPMSQAAYAIQEHDDEDEDGDGSDDYDDDDDDDDDDDGYY